jgi:hypothetical protein
MNQQMIPLGFDHTLDDGVEEDDFAMTPHLMRSMSESNLPWVLPRTHPAGPIVDEYQYQRPYTYISGYEPGLGRVYFDLGRDLAVIHQLLQGTLPPENMKAMVTNLALRSAYEIEALNYTFRATTNGVDLALAVSTVLDQSGESQAVKYAMIGLLLGPVGFDLWLMNQVADTVRETR